MLTYEETGVSRGRAADTVDRIRDFQKTTETRFPLLNSFGLFAAGIDLSQYCEPIVFGACDGVGTKLELLQKYNLPETAGWDLVAMNVNDIYASGGDPVMFLDYIAMGKLDPDLIERLIAGMASACRFSGCTLAGGETAEMPGLVPTGNVELSGFVVGVAEKKRFRKNKPVGAGDILFGLPSLGFHANGFSLVRRILETQDLGLSSQDMRLLLRPTRIYTPEVNLMAQQRVATKATVHVTGGGIPENLARVLPDGLGASLRLPKWEFPNADKIISCVSPEEALATFNMGIGWIWVADVEDYDDFLRTVPEAVYLGEVAGDSVNVEVCL